MSYTEFRKTPEYAQLEEAAQDGLHVDFMHAYLIWAGNDQPMPSPGEQPPTGTGDDGDSDHSAPPVPPVPAQNGEIRVSEQRANLRTAIDGGPNLGFLLKEDKAPLVEILGEGDDAWLMVDVRAFTGMGEGHDVPRANHALWLESTPGHLHEQGARFAFLKADRVEILREPQ